MDGGGPTTKESRGGEKEKWQTTNKMGRMCYNNQIIRLAK